MKIGTTELIIVLIVVVIIFGPTQIPKLTKMFGKSIKEFRDAVTGSNTDNASDGTGSASQVSETKAAEETKNE